MGPTIDHSNPDALRARAASLRQSARKPSLLRFAGDMLAYARGIDASLQRRLDADDFTEAADHLETMRSVGTATPANPYGEVRA